MSTTTKITGLTTLNVRALREVFPDAVLDGELVLGKTTAAWSVPVEQALAKVSNELAILSGRSHPKASLWAVERKLRKLVQEEQLARHERNDELITKALGVGPGETLRIELDEELVDVPDEPELVTYTAEVFDSEGTLAIQREGGQDVAHLRWVDRETAADEFAEETWRELTDEERQALLNAVAAAVTIVPRLKADLAFHQAKRDELAEELSDLDEPYDTETGEAEGFHAGRVEALGNVIDILLGREVELYSETRESVA